MTKRTRATLVARKKLKLKTPRLLARLPFIKKDAKKAMPMHYYITQSRNLKDTAFIMSEKKRLSTPKWGHVTDLLFDFKLKGFTESSTSGKILTKIFKKNRDMALSRIPFSKTQNILPVIARQETLILAYGRVKRNRGALTRAAYLSRKSRDTLSPLAEKLYSKTSIAPDGLCLRDFDLASFLILKGAYPWGSSKRIWLDKPGSSKKRPITIPPFMDRVVQEAIKMVLHAIWEPDFEIMNRSFGFRPNKSCGDAITAITSTKSQGLFSAVEGDIEAAYDAVPKDKLLQQLSEKIDDNKFLKFMKKRLNYDYVDDSGRHRPKFGIPQGGIDSPYLFNIHLLALDRFIHDPHVGVQAEIDRLNSRIQTSDHGYRYKPRRNLKFQAGKLEKEMTQIRNTLKSGNLRVEHRNELRSKRYALMRKVRDINFQLTRMPYYDPSGRKLRIFYVRYADDWILLSNADAQICARLKYLIKDFLYKELGAKLSDDKTIITDMRRRSAHFLGFELRRALRGRSFYAIRGGKKSLVTSQGLLVKAYPDTQRLINRMHAKGFCEVDGFPKSVTWWTNLEVFIIIERFNASIRGLMNYYAEFVSHKSTLYRWYYILQYSCLKTIVHKYQARSISKIYKRFGKNLSVSRDKTIAVNVEVTVNGVTYVKEWSLLTFEKAYRDAVSLKQKNELLNRFWSGEQNRIGEYPLNKDRPAVTQDSFLDYITWVSFRRQAPLHMPCLICGSTHNVEMHHIRHIRKTPYTKLQNLAFLQIMQLRNRKQIPICHRCHIHVIHAGRYSGNRLNRLINYDQTLFDNRVMHTESFVNPSFEEFFGKTLIEKGFGVKGPPAWVNEIEPILDVDTGP